EGCEHRIAESSIERRGLRTREIGVDDPALVEAQTREDSPAGVDHACDSVVGDPDKRQAFLHSPDTRLVKMLVRAGRLTEPAVVGDVDEGARPLARLDDSARKDRFIADKSAHRWQSGHLE